MTTRIEKDPLGEKPVPNQALYGIQTVRAVENFPISGFRPLPAFVDAVIWIKRSAALTHKETGRLEPKLAGLPPDARARVDEITRLMVEKLLLQPTEQLKTAGDAHLVAQYTYALSRLFGLSTTVDEEDRRE